MLFFYYCGHGYKNDDGKVCFANYKGADWTAEEIVKTVNENFAGNTALFTADCCNSGGLAKEVQKYKTRNYAALNSVVPTDVSTAIVSSRFITITWARPVNADETNINGYSVYYKRQDSNRYWLVLSSGQS